jgi:PAS domain S-box-containing protein/putative nucleotidyltransferase with HDIG domain
MIRVLIVDDNEQNLYMLQVLLEGHGYEVVTAGNGAEALEAARRDPPDVLITDILMPVMDGFTLCRQWKEDEVLKAIPFVFYTATYTDPKDEELAMSLGAERFIVKPVEPDMFVGMLREVLENYKAGRLAVPREPVEEEAVYFREYNEALIRKLENKMLQLEEANRTLELEIAKRKQSEERIAHLNAVLRAIRSVNQLIVREKDRDPLLQGTCDRLIETRGYHNAWSALFDESGELAATAEAGLGEEFTPMVERLKRGELTACGRRALTQSEVVVTQDPPSACADCPLAMNYGGRGALTIRWEHGGKVYGLLSAAIPAHLTADREEQVLFQEVARDIAFALHGIELEEERKRAEEALRESEVRFRRMAENIQDGLTIIEHGKVVYVNDRACEIFGYPKDELVKLTGFDVAAPEEKERLQAIVEKARQTGIRLEELEFWIVRKDGTLCCIRNRYSVSREGDEIIGRYVVTTDITERKRAEEELIRLSSAVKTSVDTIAIIDMEGKIVDVNEAAVKMYGIDDKGDLIGQDILDFAAPEYREKGLAGIEFVLEKGYDRSRDYEVVTKDGRRIPVELSAAVMKDAHGKPIGIVIIARDITERKQAEEALRESEERLRLVVQNMPIMLDALDADNNIIVWNQECKRVTGYSATEIVGNPKALELLYADTAYLQRVLAEWGERGNDFRDWELELTSKEGSIKTVAWSNLSERFPIPGWDSWAVGVDITERKRAEEELQQSYQELQKALEGTVHALASAIEMRDPYTAGHQRRVTQLACAIANEMGLPEEQIEGLRMAALIHDMGKMTVPAEVLSKPGQLTEIEYGLIKMHSQTGHDILKDMDFPWPLAQIVLQHHERLDGSGYPQGLSGEEIMLEARILAVADVVEAMTSHRPYRAARGIDKALEEIAQNRGVLYDTEVVDACLKLFTEDGFTFE